MAINLNDAGGFIQDLGFLDSLGPVGQVLDIAITIFNFASEDYTPEPSNTEVLDQIAALSDKLDAVAPAVIGAVNDLVNDQAIGIRMQQLTSALSGGDSALDLLASYHPGNEVLRTAIIVEASGAFRDTLAQAISITTPTEFYKPTFVAINTVLASVFQAMATRLSVAAVLENDELVADKISDQVEDAANFIENIIDVYQAAMEVKERTVTVENIGGQTFYNLAVELDVVSPQVLVPGGNNDTYVPGPLYRLTKRIQSNNPELELDRMIQQLKDEALEDLDMGYGGSTLRNLANDYRAMVAGVEKSLPLLIGYDSSGTLVGTDSNDLLIGNVGDDTLKGKGGNDLLRGKAGDDILQGGNGNDRLIGGEGNDIVFGQAGDDALEGNGGNDTINGDGAFSGASARDRFGAGTARVRSGAVLWEVV
jgi:RTX calcium-binding nonapeptide repeat (4 copies)